MEFSNGGEAMEMRELQAQASVWNQTYNYINSMSLKCAIELSIPETIHNHSRPMTLPELVSVLGIPRARASFLHRLMRILTHSGFFARQKVRLSPVDKDGEDGEDREGYILTPPSRLLLKGNPLSMSPMAMLLIHPTLVQQFNCLSKWFHSDSPITPFEMEHGRPYWDYMAHNPELNRIMNEAMASDGPLVKRRIVEKCRNVFEHSTSVVDVGGGTGLLAKGIADAFPHLDLIVLDLPHVVRGLEGAKNLKFLAGDMFKYIAPASTIMLKWILHDWNDEECVRILKRCKEAIAASGKSGGKVIVIEMVIEDQKEDDTWTQTELFFDMMMMAVVTGRERSEKEWARLFLEAGFNEYRITPLIGPRCLIEVHP